MSAVETSNEPDRNTPDLSFLQRKNSPPPDIPGLAENAGEERRSSLLQNSGNRILTIGQCIVVNGEIGTCDRLVVEGSVEATLTEGDTLEISGSGTFKGHAVVDNAIIAGVFDGDLTVNGRLRVASSGKVRGTVRYRNLEIEAGGELNGDISASVSGS